jgi:hypothetical protein
MGKASCHLSNGATLPEEKTADLSGAVQLFAGGATLPSGKYRLSYVGGCNIFDVNGGWNVQGLSHFSTIQSCLLVDDNGMSIANPALTISANSVMILLPNNVYIGSTYPTYHECVAAYCELPPLEFDFAGGTLGLNCLSVLVSFGVVNDLGGQSEGGRNPTYRLTRLDPCP